MAFRPAGTTTGVLRRLAGVAAIVGCWFLPAPAPGDGRLLEPLRISVARADIHEEEGPPGPPVEELELEDLEEVHEVISEALLATADWIDSFFVTERALEETNQSFVRLGLFSGIALGEGVGFNLDTNVRLVLPRTREQLHLVLAGEADDEFDPQTARQARRRTIVDARETDERSDIATALQYFFQATARRNISLRAGLRFRDFTPVFFTGPRYRETFDLDPWTGRFTGSLLWFTDEGFETRARLDFERPVFGDLFFRATPEALWSQEEDGIEYRLGFNLFQPLGLRQALDYQWINRFKTEPTHALDATALRVRYRQTLWRDWVILELAPELALPRDRDYRLTPGFVMGLSVIFGHYGLDGWN